MVQILPDKGGGYQTLSVLISHVTLAGTPGHIE